MHHRNLAARSLRIGFVCAIAVCAQADRAAADAPPYQAKVIVSGAPVLSGPGENFYPTETLNQGDVVEVYRQKPGGWLAIRPTANSFSWVAARDLVIKDGGLAEAASDNVASRIGSRLNDKRNAAQVRLKKGEVVELLGEENINGQKWCKIAPPAGEFRWIQSSVVEKVGTIPPPSDPNATATATTASAAASAPAKADESGAPPLVPDSKAVPTNSAGATSGPQAMASPPSNGPDSNGQQASSRAVGDLSHELAAIELRLSRMAAAPTNLWNTERLEHDAAQLMARAQTPAERDAVRITQDKINHFAEIGRRATQTAGGGPPTPPGINATGVGAAAAGGQYDAVGILRPVVSRRAGAPQFALVDERGQVVTFVTATPDLNLQPYLGHKVGVVGNRGYMPEFQRGYVTATRVTPLNERMVR